MGCGTERAVNINIDDPAPDDLSERFAVLAFRNELGEEIPLTRFEAPVRVYAQGPRYGVSDTVADLAAATGHDIRQVWSGDEANIIVTVAPWPVIRRELDTLPNSGIFADPGSRFTCAALPYHSGQSEIFLSLVFIDADLGEAHIRRCMIQEVAQSLGLPNDIDDPDGTIFSSYSLRHSLSASDYAMLETLYDERLRPGMTRREAMPVVRDILSR